MSAIDCDELAPVTIVLPATIRQRLRLGALAPFRAQVERVTRDGRTTLPRAGWDHIISRLVCLGATKAGDELVHALGQADPEGYGW